MCSVTLFHLISKFLFESKSYEYIVDNESILIETTENSEKVVFVQWQQCEHKYAHILQLSPFILPDFTIQQTI